MSKQPDTTIANDLAILRSVNDILRWLKGDDEELASAKAIINRKMFELQAEQEKRRDQ